MTVSRPGGHGSGIRLESAGEVERIATDPIASPVMVTLLPSTNAPSAATLVVPVVSPNAWLLVTFRMPELTMTFPEKVLAPDNINVPAGIGKAGGAGCGEERVSEPLAMMSLMVSTAPLATVIVLGPPRVLGSIASRVGRCSSRWN